jgi:YD repeat-containing protein
MLAYKASYNGKCKDITYEVGKTYIFKGQIELCCSGFHFCLNAKDLLSYYPYKKDLVIFEIEVESNNVLTRGDKSVTNYFKVLRQIPKEAYQTLLDIKLDSEGNMAWQKTACGVEYNYKYDSKGNMVWYKDSNGYEVNFKYDSMGNKIWQKDSRGNEFHYTYDPEGNLISEKNYYGNEENYKYDSKGNLIWKKYYSGFEENYKYDSKSNLIWTQACNFGNGGNYTVNYTYDSEGNLIYRKDTNGFELIARYDSKGNKIWQKDSYGNEWSIEIK